ncbi:MAG TPA: glycosyltransferase family 1 protein [Acidimicrobiales bacterium]|nr:glycosyltransferase family 1 protein [Acidimicrobiales bacterium]
MAPLATSLDVSAIPDSPAGAGRYVVELVRALGKSGGVALSLVCRHGDTDRWRALAPSARLVDTVWTPRPLRVAYEQWRLGPVIGHLRDPAIAVHHGPHYTFPHGLGSIGSVVTVHDLTFFDHPEWHVTSKVRFFQRAIRRAASEADVIICVSDTTAERLGALLSPKGAVFVAPHGVDHARFRPADGEDGSDAAALARYGCPPDLDYLFQLATIEPRKGTVPLVEAFDRLAEEHKDLELVLAGIDGWGAAEVTRAIAASRHQGRVRRLGYVDDDAVPALLRRARVVAYPSFEEGFGLPALEALACGAPLVTTSGTAMAEVAGPAAWTAPAGDAVALAAALEAALLAGGPELARRRAEGLERAAAFTWERTAAVHLEAYEAAAR